MFLFLSLSYSLMAGIYSRGDKCREEPTVLLTKAAELLAHHFSLHAPERIVLHISGLSLPLPKEGLRVARQQGSP